MNFRGELKKAVLYHLAAGAALSAAVFFLVLSVRYSGSVGNTASKIETIRQNTVRMEEATRMMIERQETARSILPADYEKRSHREIILLALERAKGTLKGAEIKVENFATENGELTLPVAVELKAGKYSDGVRAVEYLEAQRFPYFRVASVTVKRQEGTDELLWRVEGELRMPEERMEIVRSTRAAN